MFLRSLIAASALALASSPAFADSHAGNTGYALAYDSNTLVVMPDIAAPDAVQTFDLEKRVDALAWRPVTGQLLGFSNGAIYDINPRNGRMTNLKAKFKADAKISDDAPVDQRPNRSVSVFERKRDLRTAHLRVARRGQLKAWATPLDFADEKLGQLNRSRAQVGHVNAIPSV